MIEGVIKRSRITPGRGLASINDFYLDTSPHCFDLSKTADLEGHVVHFEVMYGDYPLFYDKSYGTMGSGSKEFLLNAFKSFLEDAITDFLEVNFLMDD